MRLCCNSVCHAVQRGALQSKKADSGDTKAEHFQSKDNRKKVRACGLHASACVCVRASACVCACVRAG
jgi:hypothetical protein